MAALTLFFSGTFIAALAGSFTALLVGRTVQGIGAGGISVLTYVITTDLVALKDRGRWFGLIALMWAIGTVFGPIIGGAFAHPKSWVYYSPPHSHVLQTNYRPEVDLLAQRATVYRRLYCPSYFSKVKPRPRR